MNIGCERIQIAHVETSFAEINCRCTACVLNFALSKIITLHKLIFETFHLLKAFKEHYYSPGMSTNMSKVR